MDISSHDKGNDVPAISNALDHTPREKDMDYAYGNRVLQVDKYYSINCLLCLYNNNYYITKSNT